MRSHPRGAVCLCCSITRWSYSDFLGQARRVDRARPETRRRAGECGPTRTVKHSAMRVTLAASTAPPAGRRERSCHRHGDEPPRRPIALHQQVAGNRVGCEGAVARASEGGPWRLYQHEPHRQTGPHPHSLVKNAARGEPRSQTPPVLSGRSSAPAAHRTRKLCRGARSSSPRSPFAQDGRQANRVACSTTNRPRQPRRCMVPLAVMCLRDRVGEERVESRRDRHCAAGVEAAQQARRHPALPETSGAGECEHERAHGTFLTSSPIPSRGEFCEESRRQSTRRAAAGLITSTPAALRRVAHRALLCETRPARGAAAQHADSS